MLPKKQHGVVFTPSWVAEYMVKNIFSHRKITGDEKILDAGCGNGVFSIAAAQCFAKLAKKPIEKVIQENMFFIDINAEYVQNTTDNLLACAKSNKNLQANGICGDFCWHDFENQSFDYIIGNPPYVRIQNLEDRRPALKKRFFSASSGASDLYFCFFERAMSLLAPNGLVSFITPNSYFFSHAGRNLRGMIGGNMVQIIDIDHHQIFENATTYTAISCFSKEKSKKCLFGRYDPKLFPNIAFKNIDLPSLQETPWSFVDENLSQKMKKLRDSHSTLGQIADIHYGIATLKDDIFIFRPENQTEGSYIINGYAIEKSICVPIIKASTFKGSKQNLKLLFPYQDGKLISEDVMKQKFPNALKYLSAHRNVLEARDKGGGKHYKAFYAFGRTQGLKNSFGPKILTSPMNKFPRFFVSKNMESTFFAGYCIKPKNASTNLNDLCKVLNSSLMHQFITGVSRSYRGGYKSYAKSFLQHFVHESFSPRRQHSLFSNI